MSAEISILMIQLSIFCERRVHRFLITSAVIRLDVFICAQCRVLCAQWPMALSGRQQKSPPNESISYIMHIGARSPSPPRGQRSITARCNKFKCRESNGLNGEKIPLCLRTRAAARARCGKSNQIQICFNLIYEALFCSAHCLTHTTRTISLARPMANLPRQ